jgi:hypothetical protein
VPLFSAEITDLIDSIIDTKSIIDECTGFLNFIYNSVNKYPGVYAGDGTYNMTEFLLFCIATIGMSSIITQGVIFQPFRQFLGDRAETIREHWAQQAQATGKVLRRSFVEWFNELGNCAQCTGFWCGLFCGLFLLTSERYWITEFDVRQVFNTLLMWFCCGVGGSFVAALGCNVIEWVFYHKMNALRRLEEQDLILAERRTGLPENQE